MKKEYVYILVTYILMLLSGAIGYPVLYYAGVNVFHEPADSMRTLTPPLWTVISFIIGLIIVLYLLRKAAKKETDRSEPLPAAPSAIWAISGVFLCFFAQTAAAIIESLFGVPAASNNTQQIMALIERFPLVILISSIAGPILEEIVFRKIIFGTLRRRFSFLLSGIVSSVIFGLAHTEPSHLFLYSLLGLTLAYLYEKTNRITVSMFAHVSMNTIVVVRLLLHPSVLQTSVHEIYSSIGGLL
ncbi:CPBP family intramembrane metalloprotease [Heyndrickxia coagulans]|uniref:CPBP family intramembrane glutamic endopeptidase n=1 Tax=Heyndrickxia coagulans TaxID=1398 RepID=UPI00105D0601|nr:CPBP family intramembrane glutamic endopeptidase [Heyndrickxia coagulans]MBF8417290.1 CPBP family intramembrane metalloprotease [Heyndrickxia coagulans]UJZ87283.1 CPBP family intramembrane metalloprotease [Heyndrickxia coagulans]